MHAKYCCYLLALLGPAQLVQAQNIQSTENQKASISIPFRLPLLAYVGSLTVKPTAREASYRTILSSQKVRTITRLTSRPGVPPDTLDYSELDRRGNTVVLYVASNRQRSQMTYDNQNRIIERVKVPYSAHSYQIREKFDLQQKQFESFRQEEDGTRQDLLTGRQQSHGDTTIITTQFPAVVSLQLPIVQTVCRSYPTRGDTIVTEIIGYGPEHHILDYDAYASVQKHGRSTATGRLYFKNALTTLLDTSVQARQWRSQGLTDIQILVRRRQQLHGQFITTDLRTYNTSGQLVLHETLSPVEFRTKPITHTTNTSRLSIQSGSVSSTVRYNYNKKGQLVEQETWQSGPLDTASQSGSSSKTVKTYTSKGLLYTETTSQQNAKASRQLPPSQVEYRYTYY